jgi:hypothetical protein
LTEKNGKRENYTDIIIAIAATFSVQKIIAKNKTTEKKGRSRDRPFL